MYRDNKFFTRDINFTKENKVYGFRLFWLCGPRTVCKMKKTSIEKQSIYVVLTILCQRLESETTLQIKPSFVVEISLVHFIKSKSNNKHTFINLTINKTNPVKQIIKCHAV